MFFALSGSLGVSAEEDETIDDEPMEDLGTEDDVDDDDDVEVDEDGKVESEDDIGEEPEEPGAPQPTDADTVSNNFGDD